MEWQVFGVIVALIGFVAAIVGPIIKLNSSITRLTVTMERLVQDMAEQRESSHDAHKRLWGKNDEQDARLGDHETRITTLERKGKE
jgi:hypothetical protein